MIVTCEKCEKRYDDESRWTICPHNSLNVAHDTPYCRRHDLYNCGICRAESEGKQVRFVAPHAFPMSTTEESS